MKDGLKKKFKLTLLTFLALLGLAGGPAIVLAYTFYLEPIIGRVDIVVAKQDIERGKKLSADQFELKAIKKEEVVDTSYKNIEELIDTESRYLIKKGQQIIPEMIDKNGVYPNPDQWNAPLPQSWLFAVPGSLLRGDHVTIYAVPSKEKEEKFDVSSGGFVQEKSIPKALSPDQIVKIADKAKILVLDDVVVSYSKANNNVEVTSKGDQRLEPTGSVAAVEIIVNQDQWKKLSAYALNGYQFILMYR